MKQVALQKIIPITDLDLSKEKCHHCKGINLRKDGNLVVCDDCGDNWINQNMMKNDS